MKTWQTSGGPKQGDTHAARWLKWPALALMIAAAVLLTKSWWMPESDDMRRFKADWKTCKASESAEVQLQACTRLVFSKWLGKSDLADAYNNLGLAYWRLDRFEQSLIPYNVAIELNPNHDSAYMNRGNSYAFLKKDSLAIADYTRALEINPKDDFAYMNRGTTYFALSDFRRAILDFDQAIKLKPKDAGLLMKRGHAWRYLGQNAKADADFAAARAIDPKIDVD